MKTLENYIDEFKEKLRIESDYKLAKELGVTRQYISRIRSGMVNIGRDKCLRIAQALQIDPLEIVGAIEASKEKRADIKAIWIRLQKEKMSEKKRQKKAA